MRGARLVVAAMLVGLPIGLAAQEIGNLGAPVTKPKSYVLYAAEEQSVKAGKKSVLELHFKVMEGFHVNSHTPKSELLIPTQIAMQPAEGVAAEAVEYPAGIAYSFSFDPMNKLDVYSGDFTLKLPVVATAGTHTVTGSLRYQACDHAACYPPKSLPVQVNFTAK